ncbi:CD209 antigen-like protein B [Montipora foliosa]|uniref:CD209 antigen-like protein B n=1 Tax=Montipora foliosa TaxID=591990 RepID=UPI0035F19114
MLNNASHKSHENELVDKTDYVYHASSCPKNWMEHDKYCYKLASAGPGKLDDARKKCQEMLADLSIIKSKQENTFMGKPWFRLSMKRRDSQLLWFDGISAERSNKERYNAWAKGEPKKDEDCAYVRLNRE